MDERIGYLEEVYVGNVSRSVYSYQLNALSDIFFV